VKPLVFILMAIVWLCVSMGFTPSELPYPQLGKVPIEMWESIEQESSNGIKSVRYLEKREDEFVGEVLFSSRRIYVGVELTQRIVFSIEEHWFFESDNNIAVIGIDMYADYNCDGKVTYANNCLMALELSSGLIIEEQDIPKIVDENAQANHLSLIKEAVEYVLLKKGLDI